uniref:Mitochondrial ribosomal protein S9 n=1 Tax=Sinocyclocheilus grahami TaxID=75366 RepID=A0A672RU80_SINGR
RYSVQNTRGKAVLSRLPLWLIVSATMDAVSSVKKNLAAAGPQKFTQEFIDKQVEEFEVGKRHLANMMEEDPEDIDRSIAYLFPSGLFEKRARPVMKEIFPKQTAIQWDAKGCPFHFLFYTGKQSYYSLLHDVYEKILAMERHQDNMRNKGLFTLLTGSRWLLKEEIEEYLVENISDHDYMRMIQLMEKLLSMPYCSLEEEFILKFRKQLEVQSSKHEIPALQYDPQEVAFSIGDGRRKTAKASITLRDSGSGNITINGLPPLYIASLWKDPYIYIYIHTYRGGFFIRAIGMSQMLFICYHLFSLITQTAGLLTADPRIRERNKPGQEGARKKFTWKKH